MILAAPHVRGREHVKPAVFLARCLVVCNHVTYLDVGFVLAGLPSRFAAYLGDIDGWRTARRDAPPASRIGFLPRRALERLKYFLVVALFNVFPLPRRSGFRESFAFAGELIERGESVLIFPEGELTSDGQSRHFVRESACWRRN